MTCFFAAAYESACGTSHHSAATQHFGRFRGEADISRQAKPAGSVENDPSATWVRSLAYRDLWKCLATMAGVIPA
jgi:hypothetical protein